MNLNIDARDERTREAVDALIAADDFAVLTRKEGDEVMVTLVGDVAQIGAMLRGVQRVVDDQLLGVVDDEDDDGHPYDDE